MRKRAYYDDLSKKYDDCINSTPYEMYRFQEITKEILSHIPKRKGLKILDLGCGTGEFVIKPLLNELEECEVRGMDFSKGMIKMASSRFPKGDFLVGDAHNLPFNNDIFDIVTSREVLEHLSDPKQTIKEMNRVVKKDGYVIISTPSWFGFIAPLYFIKKRLGTMQPIDDWWTPFSLKKAFKDADFKVEIMRGVNPTPYHGSLPNQFVPIVKMLDKILLKAPMTKYFCRTLILKVSPK